MISLYAVTMVTMVQNKAIILYCPVTYPSYYPVSINLVKPLSHKRLMVLLRRRDMVVWQRSFSFTKEHIISVFNGYCNESWNLNVFTSLLHCPTVLYFEMNTNNAFEKSPYKSRNRTRKNAMWQAWCEAMIKMTLDDDEELSDDTDHRTCAWPRVPGCRPCAGSGARWRGPCCRPRRPGTRRTPPPPAPPPPSASCSHRESDLVRGEGRRRVN